LGSFLREFRFGHVRQLDAVASRFLRGLAGPVLLDVDDSIVQVHGYAKQGAGFGYSGVRGLNMLLATVSTAAAAPVIVAQRLRKGSCASPRGAQRLVRDALATVRSLRPHQPTVPVLLRADSAFYGWPTIGAAVRAGAQVSVTVRMAPKVKAAIATIAAEAWTPIEYTDAVYDSESGQWIRVGSPGCPPPGRTSPPSARRSRRSPWTPNGIYVDHRLTGTNRARPGLREALAARRANGRVGYRNRPNGAPLRRRRGVRLPLQLGVEGQAWFDG
jgi:hypothetical protein